MKIAVVQTRPLFGDKAGNLARAVEMMRSVTADLYVIPELFATGYLFASREELAGMAEPADGTIVQELKSFSRRQGCMVYAGFAESEDGRIFNSSALLVHGELAAKYRKLHLFKKEKEIFDRSENPPRVVEVPGARLGLMICFDWIFPEIMRSLALQGADLICHPANLVLSYCQEAMKTRCLENGVFAITANRVGADRRPHGTLEFTGKSQIVAPKGDILHRSKTQREEIFIAEIDSLQARDKKMTELNDLFQDRRPMYYKRLCE